jgi:hypothetical protein
VALTKTPFPISREQFRAGAQPLKVTIAGFPMTADPKEFSTGSLGWNINGKLQIELAGKLVMCQVGLNVTLAGSKDLPQ